MTAMTIFLAMMVLMGLCSSLNPVKMSFILVVLSLMLYTLIFLSIGSVWMSSIFFMIFIGGIMIMFMILSSLLPNEKNLKSKKIIFLIWMLLALSVGVPSFMTQMDSSMTQETKIIFMSSQSFEVLMMVTFLYFLSFVFIISKESSSLRSFVCQIKKTL